MAFQGGSLVSHVVQKSSSLDEKVLEGSTQKLSKKVAQLRTEVYENVKQNYVDFQSYAETTISVEERLRDVGMEYRRLEARVSGELKERIVQSAEKRQETESKLKDIQSKVDFVRRLVSIHELLQSARQSVNEGNFSQAVECLQHAKEELQKVAEGGCEAMVFAGLQLETATLCSEMDLSLMEEWSKYVSWSHPLTSEEHSVTATLKTKLQVLVHRAEGDGELGDLANIVAACKSLGTWEKIRSSFGKKLLRGAIIPLIRHPILRAVKAFEAGKEFIVLKFQAVEEAPPKDRLPKLFDSLLTVFSVVQHILAGEEEWMWEVGQAVCQEMVDSIIDHCLTPTVPKTREELKQYEHVGTLTSEFERKLIHLGMVDPGFVGLSNFTRNVSVHFAEEKRKDLLIKARSILKTTIHETVVVTPTGALPSLESLPISPREPTPEEAAIIALSLEGIEAELKDLGVKFPVCAVSKCVVEFVQLLDQTLRECFTSKTATDKSELFHSTRDMIDLYCAVIPIFHKLDITTIPRAAAVNYNNAMYVTHYLIVVGPQIQSQLQPELAYATFLDQIPIIRKMGEDAFQTELGKQENSILSSLKSFGDFRNVSNDSKRDDVYRGVQQGLFQLAQLSRVYKEALPSHVHRKAVGSLLDSLVLYVVKGIVALEDIVSADASELHEILTIVIEKGSSVMLLDEQEAASLSSYCPSWPKLQELVTVLNARLQEIVDWWASGKGGLAQHFKPSEIRGLIKALFKNTDHRAAALSNITL